MGGVKRYIEQMEAEEAMHQWIEERVDFDVMPGDPDWEEQKERYLSGEAFESEWDLDEYDGGEGFDDICEVAYTQFNEQINSIVGELSENPSASAIKMNYSYTVTLMETCLGDMIKSVVISDDYYIQNAIENVNELKITKLSLSEVFKNKDIVRKVVLKTFSAYLYHNVEKIIPIYSAVLGEGTPESVRSKMKDVMDIIKNRHDIVHRNGYDTEGVPVNLRRENLIKAIEDVQNFICAVKGSIDAVKANRIEEF